MAPLKPITVSTTPFKDQKPGTSGLRKKVKVFQQNNYVENFVQSTLNTFADKIKGSTLVVGGDGRFFMQEAVQKIIPVCAGNGVKHLIIGQNGLLSTPAVSAIIRKRATSGGIVLTASHNPGGPDADFGIKFNVLNGGPAPDLVTQKIYEQTLELKSYKSVEKFPRVDLNAIATNNFELENGGKFTVEIIDSVEDYLQLMKQLFNFEKLGQLLQGKGFHEGRRFKIVLNALCGVTGPYLKRIFVDELKVSAASIVNSKPQPDFGGHHPDPNLTYAKELVDEMAKGEADFGAAFDGDGDRNMILGKKAFFVCPSDSLAVIGDNTDLIPFFCATGVKGFARSMPTAGAIDLVAKAKNITLYEVPTGWKYFGNLMDANKLSLCGEESFGTGSDHIREKDGVWAALAWLSILAHQKQPSVQSTVESLWTKYGRNYFTRYDYEECESAGANKLMDHLESLITNPKATTSTTYDIGGKKCKIAKADNFSYHDPVDGSLAQNQGKRFILDDGSRVIFRISGTGSSGATIRVYADLFKPPNQTDSTALKEDSQKALKPLMDFAINLSKLEQFTGRKAPTVIT